MRVYKQILMGSACALLIGVILYSMHLYGDMMTFQQNIIGVLYQQNPEEASTYLYAMFEDISEENVESARLALEENGFTETGLYYLGIQAGLWKSSLIGLGALLVLCVVMFAFLWKREKTYRNEREQLKRRIQQLEELQMQEEYEIRQNERIQCFIENIAHQMKTPLSRVYSSLDIVEDTLEDEHIQAYVEECYGHLDSMNLLMKRLMDIGRLEAGKVLFQKEMLSVPELLMDVCQSCTDESSRVQIICEEELEYYGDGKWLKEAFVNILCNALEADKEGGCVEMTAARSGDFLKITIRDHGPGISEKDIPNIFDRFYLPENAKENHTGIGLNLAKLIIEGHQGSIYVYNHLEVGAVFQVILPVYESLKLRG